MSGSQPAYPAAARHGVSWRHDCRQQPAVSDEPSDLIEYAQGPRPHAIQFRGICKFEASAKMTRARHAAKCPVGLDLPDVFRHEPVLEIDGRRARGGAVRAKSAGREVREVTDEATALPVQTSPRTTTFVSGSSARELRLDGSHPPKAPGVRGSSGLSPARIAPPYVAPP